MAETLLKWRTSGRTLNANLTRKAQIVEKLNGVTLTLVQGSPSYSSLSGGTHGGWGNAADWGHLGSLYKMLAVSYDFRTLNCISYVRGLDVDQNGFKDDNFGAHLHVIDLDNDDLLTSAQLWQLALYQSGKDGLAGGGVDLEARPKVVYTLAEWLANSGELQRAEDIIMAITSANQADFNALLRAALQDPTIKTLVGFAANSLTYGDHDGDGKSDNLGQIAAWNARMDKETQKRVSELLQDRDLDRDLLNKIADKLGVKV